MKNVIGTGLFAVLGSLPLLSSASPYSEEDILHATFAAFQQPGVFSEEYISAKKLILEEAANDGSAIARLVIHKYRVMSAEKSTAVFVSIADEDL